MPAQFTSLYDPAFVLSLLQGGSFTPATYMPTRAGIVEGDIAGNGPEYLAEAMEEMEQLVIFAGQFRLNAFKARYVSDKAIQISSDQALSDVYFHDYIRGLTPIFGSSVLSAAGVEILDNNGFTSAFADEEDYYLPWRGTAHNLTVFYPNTGTIGSLGWPQLNLSFTREVDDTVTVSDSAVANSASPQSYYNTLTSINGLTIDPATAWKVRVYHLTTVPTTHHLYGQGYRVGDYYIESGATEPIASISVYDPVPVWLGAYDTMFSSYNPTTYYDPAAYETLWDGLLADLGNLPNWVRLSDGAEWKGDQTTIIVPPSYTPFYPKRPGTPSIPFNTAVSFYSAKPNQISTPPFG